MFVMVECFDWRAPEEYSEDDGLVLVAMRGAEGPERPRPGLLQAGEWCDEEGEPFDRDVLGWAVLPVGPSGPVVRRAPVGRGEAWVRLRAELRNGSHNLDDFILGLPFNEDKVRGSMAELRELKALIKEASLVIDRFQS